MNTAAVPGAPALCLLLSALLIVSPACTQSPCTHPDSIARLLVDEKPPSYYEEEFTPIPEEERVKFRMPEPAPYVLGRGDVVTLQVLSSPGVPGYEAPLSLRVKEDGKISLPLLGRIQAQGQSAIDLEETLTGVFQRDYAKNAHVSVDVTGFSARRFYVLGEVSEPSILPANGKSTLLEALINVGGTKAETADLEEAYVVRNEEPIPFSIQDIVMRGHPAGKLVMEENDVIYVPHVKDRADYVYIFGEVGSPTRIAMEHLGPRGTRGGLTLASAMAQAGGLRGDTANINDIRIYRGGWQNPKQFTIGVHELYNYGTEIHLRAGDRIAVGISGQANFERTLGPTVRLVTATASVLSLALSALSLAERTR